MIVLHNFGKSSPAWPTFQKSQKYIHIQCIHVHYSKLFYFELLFCVHFKREGFLFVRPYVTSILLLKHDRIALAIQTLPVDFKKTIIEFNQTCNSIFK